MGHGKAKNILMNLKINPSERNVKVLMQLPNKRQMDELRRTSNPTISPDSLV
jgi:hypothetical protein